MNGTEGAGTRLWDWIVCTVKANRWIAALAWLALVWELWRMTSDPMRNYYFYYNDHLLALAVAFAAVLGLGMPLAPEYASYALMAMGAAWVALMKYDTDTYPWMAAGLLVATGVLAHVRPRRAMAATGLWLAALGGVYLYRTRMLTAVVARDFGWTCALLAACVTAACYAGMSVGWRRQAKSMADAQVRRHEAELALARRRRNEMIARNIHDSLTGNLSYISLLAQRELARLDSTDGERPDDPARSTWLGVERNANDALRGVRKVIGLLDADGTNAAARAGERSFEGIMRDEEPRLEDLGIRGKTVVIDRSDGLIDPERMEAAYGLVGELYANLLRHCAPGDNAYFLRIALDVDGVTIAEANAIRHEGGPASDGRTGPIMRLPDSGTGLVSHARAIQRLGGTCDWRADGGEWLLSACIPATS